MFCCFVVIEQSKHTYMVGAALGAAIQVGSSIYGAVKSSQAAKQAESRLKNMRDDNRKWYEERMMSDYTQRADMQNILRKQRDLLGEQYQRAWATNIVAGGTDESLALQQQAANDAMGETMANIAGQSAAYKDSIEEQYKAKDDALAQQQIANDQSKAQAIAAAAGQIGSAVSGLVQGGMNKAPQTKADPGLALNPDTVADEVLAEVAAAEDEEIAKIDKKPVLNK